MTNHDPAIEAFDEAVRGLGYINHDPQCASEAGDTVCDCDPTWLLGNEDMAAIRSAASKLADARVREVYTRLQIEVITPFIDEDFGTVDFDGVAEATLEFVEKFLALPADQEAGKAK